LAQVQQAQAALAIEGEDNPVSLGAQGIRAGLAGAQGLQRQLAEAAQHMVSLTQQYRAIRLSL